MQKLKILEYKWCLQASSKEKKILLITWTRYKELLAI